MKLINLIFVTFIGVKAFAGVGFSRDRFMLTNLQGRINITCESPFNGEKTYANLDCEAERLEPMQVDYFYGPKNNADQLRLTTVKNNQNQFTLLYKYNGQLGRSEKQIQFWFGDNEKKSILSSGKNQIHYQLIAQNEIIDQGQIEIIVDPNSKRQCLSESKYSYNTQDCINVWKTCSKYFARHKYCQ